MSNGLYETPKIRVVGDRGLLVEYGDRIDPVVNQKVISIAIGLEHDAPAGVIEIIPSYRSLMIVYDPSVTTTSVLQESLSSLEKRLPEIEIPTPQTVEIPVCYGGEFGPDIQFVAENHGLTVDIHDRVHAGISLPWWTSQRTSYSKEENTTRSSPRGVGGNCQRANGDLSRDQPRRLAVDRPNPSKVVRSGTS